MGKSRVEYSKKLKDRKKKAVRNLFLSFVLYLAIFLTMLYLMINKGFVDIKFQLLAILFSFLTLITIITYIIIDIGIQEYEEELRMESEDVDVTKETYVKEKPEEKDNKNVAKKDVYVYNKDIITPKTKMYALNSDKLFKKESDRDTEILYNKYINNNKDENNDKISKEDNLDIEITDELLNSYSGKGLSLEEVKNLEVEDLVKRVLDDIEGENKEE